VSRALGVVVVALVWGTILAACVAVSLVLVPLDWFRRGREAD